MEKSKIWYLKNTDFFSDLNDEAIQYLMQNSTVKEFDRNDFIYKQHNNSNEIFFVKKGKVKIGSTSEDGKEYIKSILEFGEVFGEQTLIGDAERKDYAQALIWCCLLVMQKDSFEKLLNRNSILSLRLTKIMGEKLRKMEKKFEQVIFHNSRSRIIEFIREMANEKGKRVGYETLIMHAFTHRDIANITATSRQTVTTVLNELKLNNLIYFDRKRILIRDLAKLQ